MLPSAGGKRRPITDINVTPLVDIILVVLIIFMATAPMLSRRSVRVDVPKVKHQEKTAAEVVELLYTAEKKIVLEGKALDLETAKAWLEKRVKADERTRVLLSADQSVSYGSLMELLDELKSAGLKRISLEVKRR